MTSGYLLPVKRRNVRSYLWLLLGMASCPPVLSQELLDDIPFHELFAIRTLSEQGEVYRLFGPDSLKADTVRGPLCSALRNFHEYLYNNCSGVLRQQTKLLALLPDTAALQKQYNDLLDADTAFQRIYLRSIHREMVEPLPLDSAMRIAAHFFYLHRMGEGVTMHVCVGINKVKEMSASPSHPYHAAFCYMAIWGMEDPSTLYQKVIQPLRPELKAKPSDERLGEIEQLVYDTLANDPELRKVLLAEYERKAKYLNFELVR